MENFSLQSYDYVYLKLQNDNYYLGMKTIIENFNSAEVKDCISDIDFLNSKEE
jgi:hypothetical protein